MIRIAIFASGNGSNAVNLYSYFKEHDFIRVHAIYCNNAKAGIVERAKSLELKMTVFDRSAWENGSVLQNLRDDRVDCIVLAGFLWLIPEQIIQAFPNRILNIHPSLLPKYGGKGMYGSKVHQMVIDNGEKTSGITIHLVNPHYDEGEILLQKTVDILPQDDAESLAGKIHQLEYQYYPKVVEEYVSKTMR